ncbi:histone acetyltransferase KAT6A-like [Papaver somniferum]|uniref:histone acetyltransferase KAT6A-like n=1 Tax=Papaver somniferum TaxID=3469 RepID=UPI000E70255F|nr:histone acetyltransferase KAT6A-like [Papaver somniferum]
MAFAKLALLVALLLIISNCNSAENVSSDGLLPSSNVCVNCSICPYTCQSQPPPSPSGYPSYGAPPPPGQANCPPTPAVQCCQQHPPPNPYGYFPYDNNSASLMFASVEDLLVSVIINWQC